MKQQQFLGAPLFAAAMAALALAQLQFPKMLAEASPYSSSATGTRPECLRTTIASKAERAPIIITGKVERTFDTKVSVLVSPNQYKDDDIQGKIYFLMLY
jgi:hypothetical protein